MIGDQGVTGPAVTLSPIEQLHADYQAAGIISQATDITQFTSASQEQQATLLEQGRQNKIISAGTTDEQFYSAWGGEPVKKKRRERPTGPRTCILAFGWDGSFFGFTLAYRSKLWQLGFSTKPV